MIALALPLLGKPRDILKIISNMKKTFVLMSTLCTMAFGCTSESDEITGGDLLVEYIVSPGVNRREVRHTFKDNGTKFDKIYGHDGALDKQFTYDAQQRLISISGNMRNAGGDINGMESYIFDFVTEGISVTYERSGNAGNYTTMESFEYEGSNLVQYAGSFPPDLFSKKYVFNGQGQIVNIETYSGINSDVYDYYLKEFEYDSSNKLVQTQTSTGTYRVTTGTYNTFVTESESFEYFSNEHPNPYKDAMDGVYLNLVLTPDAFNLGLFQHGAHGTVFDNFLQRYRAVVEDSFVRLLEIRDGNVTFQTNGLPKSGFRGIGATPFEFTYTE